jgi:hypothetical protein
MICGSNEPNRPRDIWIGEARQYARDILTGSSRYANAFGISFYCIMTMHPLGQSLTQRLVAGIITVLEGHTIDFRIGKDSSA